MAKLSRNNIQNLAGVRVFDLEQLRRQQLAEPAVDFAGSTDGSASCSSWVDWPAILRMKYIFDSITKK